MPRLEIDLGERSYPIHIGAGLIADSALWQPFADQHPAIMIVTNESVAPRFLDPLRGALGVNHVSTLVLPDGEQFKTLETWRRILDRLVKIGAGRDGLVIALGGGVVGDMAGFAAASYMRGTPFVQVPTTLLAQVDSSVGGKTGVNHPGGKNLVGAFHQPRAVVSDTDTLSSLPDAEFRSGMAEVIKHAVIADADFFTWLEQHVDDLQQRQPQALGHAIARCCEIKAAVVAADETEQGSRAVLNLGHTFGHAIEAATGFRQVRHGEAVAIGMLLAARLAERSGRADEAISERLHALLSDYQLPVAIPQDLEAKRLLDLMHLDKKARGGRICFVLPKQLGAVAICDDLERDQVLEVLNGCV